MISMKRIAIAAAAGLTLGIAAPLAASADPPGQMTPNGAVIPYVPGQFENSPTSTGQLGGVAALTFDGSGRFIRAGNPDTPQGPYETSLISGPTIRQARVSDEAEQRASVDRLFAGFREQLRQLNR